MLPRDPAHIERIGCGCHAHRRGDRIVLYKGDDSNFTGNGPIVVKFDTPGSLEGCSAVFSLLGWQREFTDLSSGEISLVFSASETASMPVGTYSATVWLVDRNSRKRTVASRVQVIVTDDVECAYGEAEQVIDVVVANLMNSLEVGGVKFVGDHVRTRFEFNASGTVSRPGVNVDCQKASVASYDPNTETLTLSSTQFVTGASAALAGDPVFTGDGSAVEGEFVPTGKIVIGSAE